MLWKKRSVFLSYRDSDPTDQSRARKLAVRIRKKGLRPILEADKKRPGQDPPTALYDQLSQADAVVSVLSASAMQSHYMHFEALTAKVQNKWYPILFEDISIPEALSGPFRTTMTDAQLDNPKDAGVANFLKHLAESSSTAKLYSGATRGQASRTAISLLAVIGLLMSSMLTLTAFLSNLGNIRTQACSNTNFYEICARAGWPTGGPAPERDAKR